MKRTFLQSLALYATVIFTLVMILFPVYWLLVTALSTTDELYRLPPTFWPTRRSCGTPRCCPLRSGRGSWREGRPRTMTVARSDAIRTVATLEWR